MLALIVISPYCIQINSSEGEGVVRVCMHMRARQESRWVGILAQGGGIGGGWWCSLTDNLPIHMNNFEQ